MKIDIAPGFPLPGFWADAATAESVYEFDRRRYYLRYLDRHLLYRAADRDAVEHTLYITEPLKAMTLDHTRADKGKDGKEWSFDAYHEAFFREQVHEGHSGRCALYTCSAARDCVIALFFAPDGNGYFQDYARHVGWEGRLIFSWDGSRYGIPAFTDIQTCDWEKLLPLCEEVFRQQIWPRMNDPYVSYADFPDEPVRFTCGSRAELEHITRCICHADAGLFTDAEEDSPAVVTYTARTSRQRGGLLEWQFDRYHPQGGANAKKLCQLAFTSNAFEGGTWETSGYEEESRYSSYQLKPESVVVEVAPPSAHERAEALLTLHDWLEGRVSEHERRQLLHLSEGGM